MGSSCKIQQLVSLCEVPCVLQCRDYAVPSIPCMSASALNINSLCQCEAIRLETKKEITGENRFLLCGGSGWNERDLVAGGVVKDASDL
jgi:hypothetical protein